MTAITGSAWAPGLGYRIRWGVSDTLTLTKRSLLVWFRVPAYIFFSVIQPVIFVLLFRYVFGGAIPVNVPGGYVNFLMPGIIAQTAAFATFGTAIVLAQELKKGIIDRLKSMPIARSAVLTGRLTADTIRMFVTILIIVAVGYAVGFRFLNGFGPAVAMVVLATVFGVAIACISAFTGLAIGDEESVQSFGLIWLFPLTFVSSAFVPIATMPGLAAGLRQQPAGHVRHQRHARDGAGRPARADPVAEPVAEPDLAGRRSSSCSCRWRYGPTGGLPDALAPAVAQPCVSGPGAGPGGPTCRRR